MNPDVVVVSATIKADLPQRLYRLETEDGIQLTAGLSPQVQRLGKTFKPGDLVRVRPAGHDNCRGTILGLCVEPLSSVSSPARAVVDPDELSDPLAVSTDDKPATP